jgi:hypothetical protein
MKRVGMLAVALLIFGTGIAFGGMRGLTIKTTKGERIGGYTGSYALVVGVSNYKAGWPRLESVPSEMRTVREALRDKGFDVTLVMDPDGKQLENVFEDFIDKYGYDDGNRLLFFYAGHGYSLRDGEKGYLVPVDAPVPSRDMKNFMRRSLDMTRILALSREMSAKHALFLFDSCFSGAIFKTRALPEQPPHISAITAKPVRQFITAGSAGQEVPARSVFAPCFIKALRGEADLTRDGYVTGTELGLYLREKVMDYGTGQIPQYGKIKDPYLDEGDFVFRTGILVADGSTYGVPVSQPTTQGSLRIESQPNGAQIFLAGSRVGRTPKTLDGLNPGRVTIEARLDGYESQDKITSVLVGQSVHVGFALSEAKAVVKPGRLYVLPNPNDSQVRILNIGPKYKRGMLLKPGKYHVDVSKSGYKSVRKWVVLGAGEDLDVPVTLAIEEAVSRPKHLYVRNETIKMSHRLTWDKCVDLSTGNRVNYYIIEVAEAESKRILEKYKTKWTSYQYNRGERGKTYVFRVMAVSTSGTLSAWSSWSVPFTFQYNMELKPPTNIVMERDRGPWRRDRKKDILKWSRAVGADGDGLVYTVFFTPVTDKHAVKPVVVETLKEQLLIGDVYDILDDANVDVFIISITASDGVTKSSLSRPVKYVFYD